MDSSEDRAENDPWNFRSPCLDAHHEAFILRSSWTVDNLYAANLHLGQSYVRQVKDLEKQRKVWLSRKEKEQETMLRRWKALEKQVRNSHSSNDMSEVKDIIRPANPSVRKFRQRATTVGTSSRVAGLEKFGPREGIKHFKNCRSTSQPIESGLILTFSTKEYSAHDQFGFQKYEKLPRAQSMPSACSMYCAFASSSSRLGSSLRRTVSGLPSSIKSTRYFTTEPEENLSTISHLIPRWLPSNLRSKHIGDKSLW